MTGDDVKYLPALPVKVDVGNWPKTEPVVKKTTLKTFVLDPANGPKNLSLCDYEPRRYRLTIRPIDAAIAVTLEPPTSSPDTSGAGSATSAPQGAYLPINTNGMPEQFYGPDAMWINSLAAATRVVVKKEYC